MVLCQKLESLKRTLYKNDSLRELLTSLFSHLWIISYNVCCSSFQCLYYKLVTVKVFTLEGKEETPLRKFSGICAEAAASLVYGVEFYNIRLAVGVAYLGGGDVVCLNTQTCRAESSLTSERLIQLIHHTPLHLLILCNNHLSNSLTRLNYKLLLGEVYQYYLYLSAIVRIYGSRGVSHCNTVFCSQSAAWSYLSLIPLRQFNEESRRNQTSLQRSQCYWGIYVCIKIHTRRHWSCVFWSRVVGIVYNLYNHLLISLSI